MIRRGCIVGMVALGLALTAPSLVSSARHFEQCFRGIQGTSRALNPMERVVFGLVLGTSASAGQPNQAAAPRT